MEKKNSGTIVLIISIVAGAILIIAGFGMNGIRSQAGNTVAEFYYQKCGIACIGFGTFCIALGVGISNLINSLNEIIYKSLSGKADDNENIDDLILKYKKLLDDGTITQKEFDKKKKEILNN